MWYKCSCGNETLHLEEEVTLCLRNKLVAYLDVSIWWRGRNKPSLLEKLRHCWQILKTGQNFSDEIILDFNEVKRLANDLNDLVSKFEQNSES